MARDMGGGDKPAGDVGGDASAFALCGECAGLLVVSDGGGVAPTGEGAAESSSPEAINLDVSIDNTCRIGSILEVGARRGGTKASAGNAEARTARYGLGSPFFCADSIEL